MKKVIIITLGMIYLLLIVTGCLPNKQKNVNVADQGEQWPVEETR